MCEPDDEISLFAGLKDDYLPSEFVAKSRD